MRLVNLLKDLENLGEAFERGNEYPRIQLHTNKDNLLLLVEVPGVLEKDLEVSVSEDVVTITGKKNKSVRDNQTTPKVFCSEIQNGDFTRKIELPCEVESKDTKAILKSGVLSLSLPIKEKEKQKVIKIQGE